MNNIMENIWTWRTISITLGIILIVLFVLNLLTIQRLFTVVNPLAYQVQEIDAFLEQATTVQDKDGNILSQYSEFKKAYEKQVNK